MKKALLFSILFLSFAGATFSQSDIDCNDAQAIKYFFIKNGFKSSPVTIVGNAQAVDSDLIQDYAQLTILKDGKNVNMASLLEETVQAGASEGFNVVATITKNENLCTDDLKRLVLNDFDKDKYDTSVNAHIWDRPNSDDDLLFIRYNPVNLNK